MLRGIDQLLTGDLLAHLDAMGHSDAVVVSDGHFPASRLGARVVELPGHAAPRVMAAICSVLPLDDERPVGLMDAGDGVRAVQEELMAAAGLDVARAELVERFAFYEAAAAAYLVVRTGETRAFGNALLRKGLV